ncbi:MAG: hypothetical protein A2076_02610 [Geobacteraceae bacterium GWC2_53_11]|nr:MAG: hypothetical protein A2076_02610 [Geobacteraceae bacterium GWC2_53_11]
MRQTRVVQIGYNWSKESAGSAQAIYNFAEALDTIVISFSRDSRLRYDDDLEIEQFHIPYFESALNRYSYTWSSKKRKAEQLIANSDLLICHGLFRYCYDWAIGIAIKHKIPYWIIPHGSLDPYVYTYRTLSKRIWFTLKGNKAFSQASALIFSTEKELLKAQSFIDTERFQIVHWPVSYVDTSNAESAKIRIRSLHSIPYNAKVLLFIGRFHPSKRPLETIKVVANAHDKNIYLLMIGPDSDVLTANECYKFCKDNHFTNIRFAKPVFDMSKFNYYMAADAFISLSCRENFGYTVAEAMASGIPVILSPGNDLSKDISPLNCGWMLKDDSLNSAIDAVNEIAETPTDILAKMGQRGQHWARTELTKERFRANINALVQKTILTHAR